MSGALCILAAGGSSVSATASGSSFSDLTLVPGTAVTSACVITATGGSGSYSYAWTRTAGDSGTSISSASAASVTWSKAFVAVGTADSTWQCVVTDTATGLTDSVTGITVHLEGFE